MSPRLCNASVTKPGPPHPPLLEPQGNVTHSSSDLLDTSVGAEARRNAVAALSTRGSMQAAFLHGHHAPGQSHGGEAEDEAGQRPAEVPRAFHSDEECKLLM